MTLRRQGWKRIGCAEEGGAAIANCLEFRLQAVGPVAAACAGPRKRGTPNRGCALYPLPWVNREP